MNVSRESLLNGMCFDEIKAPKPGTGDQAEQGTQALTQPGARRSLAGGLATRHIRAEGGAVELFVGWFLENQLDDVLTHQCLALAGDLQIDLSFDIYPPEQP